MKRHAIALAGLMTAGLAACGPNFAAPSDEADETPPVTQVEPDVTGTDTAEVQSDEILKPESAPARPARPSASTVTAEIDWTKAREDMAARDVSDDDEAFQIASGDAAAPVPVLLPSGIVSAAGTENTPRFQPLSDGYFAAYPGTEYDIIVNGTNEVVGEGRTAEDANTEPRFLATSAGAQVSFARYGADYLIEFECNQISGTDGTCISEEDALRIAGELIIAGTR